MSYIENTLLPGEKVLYKAKIHPVVFLPGFLTLIFAFLLRAVANSSFLRQTLFFTSSNAVSCIIMLLYLVTVWYLIKAVIIKATTEFGVTNQRIIAKTGFIKRNTLELLLTKTESIRVNQNVLARIIGFGKITVVGTGGTRGSITPIDNPIYVRQVITQVLEKSRSIKVERG